MGAHGVLSLLFTKCSTTPHLTPPCPGPEELSRVKKTQEMKIKASNRSPDEKHPGTVSFETTNIYLERK